jgi:hypothetical protein
VVDRFRDVWQPVFPAAVVPAVPLPPESMATLSVLTYGSMDEDDEIWAVWFADFPFRGIVGALLYLAINTRPDLSFAVSLLARYGHNPTWNACVLCCRVLAYVAGTLDRGIKYSAGEDFDLHAFSDSDWAADRVTRRSNAAYVVFASGGPIAWMSKLMPTVCTSSGEAEYGALYHAIQEVIWVRGMSKSMSIVFPKPTPIFMDSSSAIQLAYNPVFHARSKHIDIKFHWLRNHVMGNDPICQLLHIPGVDNIADLPSKALGDPKFNELYLRLSGYAKEHSRDVFISKIQPISKLSPAA